MRAPNCVCKTCGKVFYAKPSQIRLRNGGQYCSRACKYSNPDAFKRGAEHHSWKGAAISESRGRERARRTYVEMGTCKRCGAPAADRHHVNGNTSDNRQENVEMLCRRCHMETDGRLVALAIGQRRKLTAEQVAEIRERYTRLPRAPSGRCAKGSVRALADEFGVTADNVKAIVTGRNWREATP